MGAVEGDEVYRALCMRASSCGRSIGVEARNIRKEAGLPERSLTLDMLLTAIGRRVALAEDEFATLVPP